MARWMALSFLLLFIRCSAGEEEIHEKIFSFFRKSYKDYAQGRDQCTMIPEESFGCHLYKINFLDTQDSSCLVQTFSDLDFAVYIKPGQNFEYLELDIVRDLNMFGISVAELRVYPEDFQDLWHWHEIRVQWQAKKEKYALLIDGKEQLKSSRMPFNVPASEFQVKTRGSSSWSINCDPREYSTSPSFSSLITPWVLLLVLALTMILLLLGIVAYVWKNRRYPLEVVHVNKGCSSEPPPHAPQSVAFRNWSQNPSGQISSSCFANPEDNIYEEIDDVFLDNPRRPVEKQTFVPFSKYPLQQQNRGSAFSTANSIYSSYSNYRQSSGVLHHV